MGVSNFKLLIGRGVATFLQKLECQFYIYFKLLVPLHIKKKLKNLQVSKKGNKEFENSCVRLKLTKNLIVIVWLLNLSAENIIRVKLFIGWESRLRCHFLKVGWPTACADKRATTCTRMRCTSRLSTIRFGDESDVPRKISTRGKRLEVMRCNLFASNMFWGCFLCFRCVDLFRCKKGASRNCTNIYDT